MNKRHSNIVAKLFCKTFYIIWKKKLNNADILVIYYFTSVIRQEEKENTNFKLLLSHMISTESYFQAFNMLNCYFVGKKNYECSLVYFKFVKKNKL